MRVRVRGRTREPSQAAWRPPRAPLRRGGCEGGVHLLLLRISSVHIGGRLERASEIQILEVKTLNGTGRVLLMLRRLVYLRRECRSELELKRISLAAVIVLIGRLRGSE